MGPGLTQYSGPYGAMGAITGLPNTVAPGIGLHRDPRSLSKQPSELVNPVQVPDHSTNKDQGARNGNCFCYQPGHVLDCNSTLSYAPHDLSLYEALCWLCKASSYHLILFPCVVLACYLFKSCSNCSEHSLL